MPRLTRALAPIILGGIMIGPFVGAPAHAAPAVGSVINVVVDTFTPLIPTRGDLLRLTGRVVNSSTQPIQQVSTRLALSLQPLVERRQLSEVANTPLIASSGNISVSPVAGSSISVDELLRPGEESPFEIVIPISAPRRPGHVRHRRRSARKSIRRECRPAGDPTDIPTLVPQGR